MRIIAGHSNKGGVGKAAASANPAHALSLTGRGVLLCDLDPQGAAGFPFCAGPSSRLRHVRFFADSGRLTGAIIASGYRDPDCPRMTDFAMPTTCLPR